LREGVLRVLKKIVGPKVDWSKISRCMQKKDESVTEYTERLCQTAAAHSGIADTSEKVLNDNSPLVCTCFDNLLSEQRNALPFLQMTWYTRTLRSNLDSLTA